MLHVGAELEQDYDQEHSLIRTETNQRQLEKYKQYRARQQKDLSSARSDSVRDSENREGLQTALSDKAAGRSVPDPLAVDPESHCDISACAPIGEPSDINITAEMHADVRNGSEPAVSIQNSSTCKEAPAERSQDVSKLGEEELPAQSISKETALASLSKGYAKILDLASSQPSALYLRDIMEGAVSVLKSSGMELAQARKAVLVHGGCLLRALSSVFPPVFAEVFCRLGVHFVCMMSVSNWRFSHVSLAAFVRNCPAAGQKVMLVRCYCHDCYHYGSLYVLYLWFGRLFHLVLAQH